MLRAGLVQAWVRHEPLRSPMTTHSYPVGAMGWVGPQLLSPSVVPEVNQS